MDFPKSWFDMYPNSVLKVYNGGVVLEILQDSWGQPDARELLDNLIKQAELNCGPGEQALPELLALNWAWPYTEEERVQEMKNASNWHTGGKVR